jgi:hypothetical protein
MLYDQNLVHVYHVTSAPNLLPDTRHAAISLNWPSAGPSEPRLYSTALASMSGDKVRDNITVVYGVLYYILRGYMPEALALPLI